MENRGKFIVIEGLDGSGKGTQIELLCRALAEKTAVHRTAEPTQYATGGLIRDALGGLTKRTPAELAGLFLADRIAHCQNPADGIGVLLAKGVSVICDRYYYSSLAYQGMDMGLDWILPANLSCPGIIKPDICIFLDVPTDEADRRISAGRASREIYENREAIERVRKMYFEVFERVGSSHNIKVIDAARDVDEVAKEVLSAVLTAFCTRKEE